jgi:t-SNARE complex subunit (syntaxin)
MKSLGRLSEGEEKRIMREMASRIAELKKLEEY